MKRERDKSIVTVHTLQRSANDRILAIEFELYHIVEIWKLSNHVGVFAPVLVLGDRTKDMGTATYVAQHVLVLKC